MHSLPAYSLHRSLNTLSRAQCGCPAHAMRHSGEPEIRPAFAEPEGNGLNAGARLPESGIRWPLAHPVLPGRGIDPAVKNYRFPDPGGHFAPALHAFPGRGDGPGPARYGFPGRGDGPASARYGFPDLKSHCSSRVYEKTEAHIRITGP